LPALPGLFPEYKNMWFENADQALFKYLTKTLSLQNYALK
jgi:hypothetical protein